MTKISENARAVLNSRYLKKDSKGNIVETPGELFYRVAKAIAYAEIHFGNAKQMDHWEKKFHHILSDLLFLPNSPTLMNAGTSMGQLSACFVLPVNDSIDAIFDTLKDTALIQQSGGGTGFNFSSIRPEGDLVRSTGGKASGPLSFMKIFDNATHYIKQGGKRRGANMGILNANHPDIESFVMAKRENGVLENFNISVGVTDTFMNAVLNDETWQLVHPKTGKVTASIKAQKLWHKITESAWLTGDPGLIFLDEINRKNPTPALGKIESTNPCGEVPLLAYEACNLGSVNLSKMVKKEKKENDIDWQKLKDVVKTGIRFLDNTIEVNKYIIPEVEKIARGNRKIGLGVMGWAELLIQLNIPYDSKKALQLGEKLMRFINEKSFEASAELAVERGPFPNWEQSVYYPSTPIRNATRTSIAPTGTISIIANTSSSIEPLFALAYQRENILNGEILTEINHLFLDYLKQNGLYTREIEKALTEKGDAEVFYNLPAQAKKLFKTALDISAEYHIQHQAVFQKYTDNGVSKTINLPEEASAEDISKAYQMAWKLKNKGITIYRYGSKEKQVLNKKGADHHIAKVTQNAASCKICIE